MSESKIELAISQLLYDCIPTIWITRAFAKLLNHEHKLIQKEE